MKHELPDWPANDGRIISCRNLKLRFDNKPWNSDFLVSFNLGLFEKFRCQECSTNCKLTTVKQ